MSPSVRDETAAAPGRPELAMSDSSKTPFLSTEPGPDFDWRVTLEGKAIAVTGANQGIGLAIAETALANAAACVYSLDYSAPGEAYERAVQQHSAGRLRYICTDVTDEHQVAAAIDQIAAEQGRSFAGLVANAGMTKHQPALAFDRAQLDRLFHLNVYGAWFAATAAARRWIALGVRGSIVFTASMTSYRPNRAAPSAPYGGTKAALRNMAHTLAMEWAPHGIRVNSVSPGFVRTALTYYTKEPGWADKMDNYKGMPRLAQPKELGGAYVYLLSDAASYTTGIDLPIAGAVGAW